MGSVWGNNLKLSIFGESHGGGIGCVLDGFPSGVAFDEGFVDAHRERTSSPRRAAKRICRKSSRVFLREKRPARRFPV